jgi:DNA-binding NarL/FixJ family response regulator
MTSPIRILTADDHALVRKGIAAILASQSVERVSIAPPRHHADGFADAGD